MDGIWKATLRTDGLATTVNVTNVHGDCYNIVPTLFLVSNGSMVVPNEALTTASNDCIAMLQIEQIGGTAWDLTIEPISLTSK